MALFGNRNTLREAREERMMEPPAGFVRNDIRPSIRNSFGSYVISRWVNGQQECLHPDGIWRNTGKNEKGKWTGFYKTRREAEYIMDTVLCGYVI